MNISDIMIHVDENLAADEQNSLEESLRGCNGVIAPRFASDRPHLLLISYDPEVADSVMLLRQVEAAGYHAQLVGM
ncbi:MAG: hypothetical protein SV201_07795 [Pseudomonadota bacterium]|nr:hypothetical protein [Pseudomonadota bacterium]